MWLLGRGQAAAFVGTWPATIRLLAPRERMHQKVALRAERAFAHYGIGRTRRGTGLLLMVSLLEREVPSPVSVLSLKVTIRTR